MGLYGGSIGLRVSQARGTILRVPIIRTIVFWGLSLGPPLWETAYQGMKEWKGN